MEMTTQAIVDAALRLSDAERAQIVSQLLETLTDDTEGISLDDPQFLEEMDSRFADPSGAMPWAQLRLEE